MTTTVPPRYLVDSTGGGDEFQPEDIVGQLPEELATLQSNNVFNWSKLNPRRLFHLCNKWAPIPVVDQVFSNVGTTIPFISKGRSRLEFLTMGINIRIRLTIQTRAGVGIGIIPENTHGAAATNITSIYTGNTTHQAVRGVITVIQDNPGAFLHVVRVSELLILSEDLWPILPAVP